MTPIPTERVVVANADQLLIVVALADPPPRTGFVERALIAAYAGGLTPILCLTKTDLAPPEPFAAQFADLDLTVVTAGRDDPLRRGRAAADRQGDRAARPFRGRQVDAGESPCARSGSGRSAWCPASARAGTPRPSRWRCRCAVGGWVIDTPGIRSFGLAHIEPDDVMLAFSDLAEAIEDCPRGCGHIGPPADPECALDALTGPPPAGSPRPAGCWRRCGKPEPAHDVVTTPGGAAQGLQRHRPGTLTRRRRSTVSTVPTIDLNDGNQIPQLGFGVFQIPPEETAAAVKTALDIGYRHIDTAEMYGNEKGVGAGHPRLRPRPRRGVRHQQAQQRLPRARRRPPRVRRDAGRAGLRLRRPVPDPLAAAHAATTATSSRRGRRWRSSSSDGRARSIGVSNFQVAHLRAAGRARPARCPRSTRSRCTRTSPTTRCAPTASSTASRPRRGRRSPRARCSTTRSSRSIAEATGKSPAQVVLRWHIQRGDIVFPKSVTPQRIKENFELFDFELERRRHRRDLRPRQGRGRPHRPEPGHVRLHPELVAPSYCLAETAGRSRNRRSSRSPAQSRDGNS